MADSNGSGTDYSKYIIPVGLVALAYMVVKNLFPTSGLTQNNTTVTTTTANATAQSLAQSQATTPATLSAAEAAAIANTVYQLGVKGQTSDIQDQIVWQIIEVNNLTDLLLVMQYFGTRSVALSTISWCATLGIDCTQVSMPTFVRGSLDTYHLSEINTFLSGANINYQF
jgi:branched-subunit amino acid permease